jgi:DNA repair protein SbcC/Rad50
MKPLKINMKNFFSHKESTIDFSFNVALLVGNTEGNYDKSNGSGKSAILEGICWALFNKCRAAKMDELVKWGEDQAIVELLFEESGDTYKVERIRNRVSGSSSVNFYKLDEIGSWCDLSGSTNTLTNKEIEKVLKCDYKTFINSVYFRQNDISEFAEAEPFRKKEILKNMIDINRWDEYEREAKDKCKSLKVSLEVLKGKLYDTEELEIKKGQLQYKIGSESSRFDKLKDVQESLETRYSHSYERYVNMKNSLDTNQFDRINLEIQNSTSSLKKLATKSEGLKLDISKIKKDISSFNKKKKGFLDSKLNLKYEENVSEKIAKMGEDLIELKSDGKLKKMRFSDLKDIVISDENCSSCGQEIDSELHKSLDACREEELCSLKNDMSELKEKIESKEIDLKILHSKKETNELITSLNGKIEGCESKVEFFNSQMKLKDTELSEITDEVKSLKVKLQALDQSLLSLKDDDFQTLKENVRKLKEDRSNVNQEIFDLSKVMAVTESEHKEVLSKIEDNLKIKVEIKELNEKIVVLEHLYKYLGKSGIQVILINSLIEDLETHTNRVLSEICNEPIAISLDTQKLRSDKVSQVETLDLNTIKDGYKYDFKSLSGGEKFRIALSTRTGLSEISSQYSGANLEFIMMDEINSPLDKHGTDNLVEIIKKLSDKYMILMITHDDRLKEKFDMVINVSKVNGESSVNFLDYN